MAEFSLLIREWYRLNGRNLPWRETNDPYKIWLSEIILQQTRVDQGISYYYKFVNNFTSISDLANAEEQEVLNLWQGLGYYSRARNLHFAAQQVINEFNGAFPDNFEAIKSLKGVGNYTASAIASFAFNETKAVVDGNVYRVLSRYFNEKTPIDSTNGQKLFQEIADSLIDPQHPGEHNQAIMELGALICTPHNPKCRECPISLNCMGRQEGSIEILPVKEKKTKVSEKFFHYLVVMKEDQLLLEKRTSGIWKNMYQFPLIETDSKFSPDVLKNVKTLDRSETKHILSHQKINATFHRINELPDELAHRKLIKVKLEDLIDYPLPRLIDKYLEEKEL